jgi:hypothetical protein
LIDGDVAKVMDEALKVIARLTKSQTDVMLPSSATSMWAPRRMHTTRR